MNEADRYRKRNLWLFPLGTVGRDMLYQLFTNFLLVYVLFTSCLLYTSPSPRDRG